MRIVVSMGLLVVVAVTAAVGFELALPGVEHAAAKVAAILRAHHGVPGRLPLPSRLAASAVAAEDGHFYTNVFLNVFDGAARAAVSSLERRGDPGGSTIAQQLAKQLYPQRPGFGATLADLGLGIKLSLSYSRRRIMQMYLNAIYYGNGYWGDVAAARGYFGARPRSLSWAEASMLAGLPQAPTAYDPLHHFALAKERQRYVLAQLADDHVLTRAQARAAFRAVLPLRHSGRR